MNFSKALEHVKAGARITRTGWNGKGLWVQIQRPDQNSKMTQAYLYLVTPLPTPHSYARIPWLASQSDLLCEDWEVLAEEGRLIPSQKLFAYKNDHGNTVYMEFEFNGNQALKRHPAKDRVIQ